MPVACGNTVLTGSSGSIAFKPAGTSVCLLDYTDFPTADPGVITLPAGNGFIVGDIVEFTTEGGATLVTGLTVSTPYTITSLVSNQAKVELTSAPGTEIAFTNSLSEDTAGGHINMKLSEFTSVCHVESFDLSLDREQIETTSLSCACETGSTENLAPFKTYQAGYIDGTGSMTVQFTEDQSSMASRLLKSSLVKDQNGAEVRLYINTVCTAGRDRRFGLFLHRSSHHHSRFQLRCYSRGGHYRNGEFLTERTTNCLHHLRQVIRPCLYGRALFNWVGSTQLSKTVCLPLSTGFARRRI